MPKTIRASDIISAQKKRIGGTNTFLLIDRLRKVERRTEERERKKLQAGIETQKLVQSIEKAGLKHRVAKIAGYEGNLLKFIFGNPQENQGYFERGLTKYQENPSLLEPSLGSNILDKLLPNITQPEIPTGTDTIIPTNEEFI